MSLTSHLKSPSSPIGEFVRTRFGQTMSITKEANPVLRAASCLQPPTTPGESYPYGTIGHAIDFRIRYAFAYTPVAETVAWQGASALLGMAGSGNWDESAPLIWDGQKMAIFDPFFDFVDAEPVRLQSVQRVLPEADEDRLSRICYVLSLFEEVFRSAQPSEALYLFANKWLKGRKTLSEEEQRQFIDELLALVHPAWVDDIRQMINLFIERGHHWFNRPCALNPTFAGSTDVGGADADLIVDGCLIDLKSGKRPELDPNDLRQLVGYILLDYHHEHAIQSVAIYKARYGLTFKWSVEEFLSRLAGRPILSLDDLRAEFHTVCRNYRTTSRA